jgi:hypothetical protein
MHHGRPRCQAGGAEHAEWAGAPGMACPGRGFQVAIYNPDIDKDGSNGRGLAAAIRSALA